MLRYKEEKATPTQREWSDEIKVSRRMKKYNTKYNRCSNGSTYSSCLFLYSNVYIYRYVWMHSCSVSHYPTCDNQFNMSIPILTHSFIMLSLCPFILPWKISRQTHHIHWQWRIGVNMKVAHAVYIHTQRDEATTMNTTSKATATSATYINAQRTAHLTTMESFFTDSFEQFLWFNKWWICCWTYMGISNDFSAKSTSKK